MSIQDYLLKNYSQSSFKSNMLHINRFLNYYGKRASTVGYRDILDYISHLRNNYNLHPKSLRHSLYGVKIYFNYLQETGKREDHPCSELQLKDKIDKSIHVDKLYSKRELDNFYNSCIKPNNVHLFNRNRVIISLLINQGLTVSEIVDLEIGDIDFNSGDIFIKNQPGNKYAKTKSPKNRVLPLHAGQVLLIHQYISVHRKEILNKSTNKVCSKLILGNKGKSLLAHSISRIINQGRDIKDKKQPLKIRQSVIANLLKQGNDTRIVQAFAGHRITSTTLNYNQSDLEQLQNEVNKHHPLK